MEKISKKHSHISAMSINVMIKKVNCWSGSQKTNTSIRGINNDHDGTRTHNLPIRSRTPYPLGHAAMQLASTKIYLNLLFYL